MTIQAHQTVNISLAERSYPIHIGAELIGNTELYAGLPNGSTAVIVSNTSVAPLYAETLRVALSAKYSNVLVMELLMVSRSSIGKP